MKTNSFQIRPLSDSLQSSDGTVILDITATGRYWRTSDITSVSLIRLPAPGEHNTSALRLTAEKQEDEYEILTALAAQLDGVREIITFNGNAFDLPHLHAKYKAYGLADPLTGKNVRDLFAEYRFLAGFLGLPGRHLRDYDDYLLQSVYAGRIPQSAAAASDAEKTLRILSYDALIALLDGHFTFVRAEMIQDAETGTGTGSGFGGETGSRVPGKVLFTLEMADAFPGHISVTDEDCHLAVSGRTAQLLVRLTDGQLKYYHADTENYVYLPLEGYAVHRSVGAYVDKKHKEKAVRTNCFHLFTCSDTFLSDRKQLVNYLSSLLQFLHSR